MLVPTIPKEDVWSQSLWQSVLGEIEVSVSHATFMTWFAEYGITGFVRRYRNDCRAEYIRPTPIWGEIYSQIREILAKTAYHQVRFTTLWRLVKNAAVSRDHKSAINLPADRLVAPVPKQKVNNNGLNPRYTFSNFIVGSSNDL